MLHFGVFGDSDASKLGMRDTCKQLCTRRASTVAFLCIQSVRFLQVLGSDSQFGRRHLRTADVLPQGMAA